MKKLIEIFSRFYNKLFNIAMWLLVLLIYLCLHGVWIFFVITILLVIIDALFFIIFDYNPSLNSWFSYFLNYIEDRFGTIGVILEIAFIGTLYPLYQWFFGGNYEFLQFVLPPLDDDKK